MSITDLLDPELLNQFQAAGEKKIPRPIEAEKHQTLRHKSFRVRLLDEDMIDGALPTDNAFASFALENPVLQLLTRALGEAPKLDYVLLKLSHGSGGHPHLLAVLAQGLRRHPDAEAASPE